MGNTITLEQQNGQWMEVAPLSGLADISSNQLDDLRFSGMPFQWTS